MTKSSVVCTNCTYSETCTENCEAYMVLARLTINIGDYNSETPTGWERQTPKDYLFALEDDLRGITEV